MNGKACRLIFQDSGSHKPNYIYISFYQNNTIIEFFNYFPYKPPPISAIYIKTVNTEQTSIH
jgi:hypothetical protein